MDSKKLAGLVSEEELEGLVGAQNDANNTIAVASIGDIISLITDYICPSSACTNAGYC